MSPDLFEINGRGFFEVVFDATSSSLFCSMKFSFMQVATLQGTNIFPFEVAGKMIFSARLVGY